jgi:hypothetical protein
MSETQTDTTKAETVKEMAEMAPTALYALEDGVEVAEPFGEEAVEGVRGRANTFLQKRAMPYGDNEWDDEAVGVYEVAQAAVEAEGGEPLSGDGVGSGFYARSAYRKNMWRLAELVDGVKPEELDIEEPPSMEP